MTTMLWLTGWSMPDTVFDRLRALLPDYHHVSVNYGDADSPEKMLHLAENAARRLGPALIGGWSLGGLLALRLAAQGLADGLVLFGATARFTRPREENDRGWADAFVRQMISALAKDRHAVETKFRQLVLTESEGKSGLGQRLPSGGDWTTSALTAGLRILRTEDLSASLLNIDCPVLVVHGTEDRICPYGAALELIEFLPDAKLISLPECGHAPFLGMEDRIAEELRRWWHEQRNKRYRSSI